MLAIYPDQSILWYKSIQTLSNKTSTLGAKFHMLKKKYCQPSQHRESTQSAAVYSSQRRHIANACERGVFREERLLMHGRGQDGRREVNA